MPVKAWVNDGIYLNSIDHPASIEHTHWSEDTWDYERQLPDFSEDALETTEIEIPENGPPRYTKYFHDGFFHYAEYLRDHPL